MRNVKGFFIEKQMDNNKQKSRLCRFHIVVISYFYYYYQIDVNTFDIKEKIIFLKNKRKLFHF